MMKQVLLVFLLAHLLGDFYFQPQAVSDKKTQHLRYIVYHGVQYAAVMFAVVYLIYGEALLPYAFAAAVLHLIIDAIKFSASRKIDASREGTVYLIDQALHLIVIAVIAYSVILQYAQPAITSWLDFTFNQMGMDADAAIAWAAALCAVMKPANISVKKLIGSYKPKDEPSESASRILTQSSDVYSSNKAGALIGTLERLIMLILISLKQYSAIGLVLTAKSIARYKKIEEDPAFGEYYLLGTLLSTLIVIVITVFIF